jgi:hypothetical protein
MFMLYQHFSEKLIQIVQSNLNKHNISNSSKFNSKNNFNSYKSKTYSQNVRGLRTKLYVFRSEVPKLLIIRPILKII